MNAIDHWGAHAPAPRELTGDDEWNIFLSYRSVNRAWVLNLYDVLRQHGHTVFLDQVALKAGDQLTRTLEEGLTKSQTGVLVWSSATADSEWVRREYEAMESMATSKQGFQFVPVRLDESELPLFARSRVFLDFSAYPDGPNGGELLRLLHSVAGEALSEEAARFASEQDEASRRATASVDAAILNGDGDRLVSLFQEGGLPWQTSSALGSKAAEGLVSIGKRDEAMAMLTEMETQFPGAIRPKQLHALALARRGEDGDLGDAQTILGQLYASNERDPETLGIYGRTWMDRYADSGDPRHLRRSRDLYVEAFEGARDDYYTGINAAAKSVLLGDPNELEAASDYARRVQEIVGTEPTPGDYWATATVGEVFLIQGDYTNAGRLYEAAVAMTPESVDSHASTWTQALRLMAKLQPGAYDRALVREAFEHLPDGDD